MEHLSDNPEDCPNLQESSHKLYDEIGHPDLSLTENWKWKLRQQHDRNFPMEGNL